jgi:hypothetical protein
MKTAFRAAGTHFCSRMSRLHTIVWLEGLGTQMFVLYQEMISSQIDIRFIPHAVGYMPGYVTSFRLYLALRASLVQLVSIPRRPDSASPCLPYVNLLRLWSVSLILKQSISWFCSNPCRSKSLSCATTDGQSAGLGVRHSSGSHDQTLFLSDVSTRRRVCSLLLLILASAVVLGSESHGTQVHNLLPQIRYSSNLEGQVSVFTSPTNRVVQLYPQELGLFFVASYDLIPRAITDALCRSRRRYRPWL